MDKMIDDAMNQAISYREYRDLIDNLLEQGRTTGPNQSDDYIHYTKMNVARMRRLDKTTTIIEDIRSDMESLNRSQVWLVTTEAWCGDAAQVIPVIEAMAALSDYVETRYVFREEHTQLIDLYLTEGSRSIPKILLIDRETDEVYSSWGPRPSELQSIVMENKHSDDPKPYSDFSIDVQRWYLKDKTVSTQVEFASVIC